MVALQTPIATVEETEPLNEEDEEDSSRCIVCHFWNNHCRRKHILPTTEITGEEGKQVGSIHSEQSRGDSTYRHSFWTKFAVPCTLDKWRWGVQECLTLAFVLWIPYVDVVNRVVFAGNGRWCVPPAVSVIEGTAGGSNRRMLDRIIGTLLSGAYVACSFLIFYGAKGQDDVLWKRLASWLLVCLSGWWWGWLRWRFPSHPLLALTAAFTTPILYTGGVTGMDPIHAAWMRTFAALVGVVSSAMVVRYFFPKRARIDVIINLETILKEMADTLEPLVELESGLVSSPSFLSHGDDVFTANSERSRTGKVSDLTHRHRVRVLPDAWMSFRDTVWARLERCGKLTLSQITLMAAAKGEISVRSNHHLFAKELNGALMSTRTLFYHVTSLFTLIETQVSATSTSFEDASLSEEARLFGRFGMLSFYEDAHITTPVSAKPVSVPNLYNMHPPTMKRNSDATSLRSVPYSVADLGQFDLRRWESVSSHFDTVFHIAKIPLDPVEEYNADVAPFLHWAELYGPTIGGLMRHMCGALRSTARDLKRGRPTHAPLQALEEARKLIAHFHRQRSERQQAVAILVEYLVKDMVGGSFAHDAKFATRFDRVLGIAPETYRSLTHEGRETFWTNYWILRDRLSTTDTTIVSLFVAVSTVVKTVRALIEERVKRMARHHGKKAPQDMLVSADEVRLRAEIAVQAAGGAARNIG